jgi:hypothetical protein
MGQPMSVRIRAAKHVAHLGGRQTQSCKMSIGLRAAEQSYAVLEFSGFGKLLEYGSVNLAVFTAEDDVLAVDIACVHFEIL